MSRDTYLDAMLRHLGAAYYESLHGRASAADVARARAAIEERVGEQPESAELFDGKKRGGTPPNVAHHHGRWHSTMRDVMTTKVVTVDRITPYKEIVRLLAEHKISAVPVLTMGRHVAGVVSEADLLAAEDQEARKARAGKADHLPWSRGQGKQHPPLTAEQLMTSPAVTIHPDAPIPRAASLMHSRHVKRLPVVDPDGKLLGIVSRRDLLTVFLRPDAQIAAEVRELLAEILFANPASVSAKVHEGVVVLTGQPTGAEQHDLIPVAVRLIWDIDGVVDVVEKLDAPTSASQ
ncbi:MAG: CBS domain-containing protein [Streptosporangiaceae bacterium]